MAAIQPPPGPEHRALLSSIAVEPIEAGLLHTTVNHYSVPVPSTIHIPIPIPGPEHDYDTDPYDFGVSDVQHDPIEPFLPNPDPSIPHDLPNPYDPMPGPVFGGRPGGGNVDFPSDTVVIPPPMPPNPPFPPHPPIDNPPIIEPPPIPSLPAPGHPAHQPWMDGNPMPIPGVDMPVAPEPPLEHMPTFEIPDHHLHDLPLPPALHHGLQIISDAGHTVFGILSDVASGATHVLPYALTAARIYAYYTQNHRGAFTSARTNTIVERVSDTAILEQARARAFPPGIAARNIADAHNLHAHTNQIDPFYLALQRSSEALSDSTTVLRTISGAANRQLQRIINSHVARPTLPLAQPHSAEDASLLQLSFSGFRVQSVSHTDSHPIAFAVRMAFEHIIANKLEHEHLHSEIALIGANAIQVLFFGHVEHSCHATITGRDTIRLNRLAAPPACTELFQECQHIHAVRTVAVNLFATGDLSLAEFAVACIRKNIQTAYVTINIPLPLLDDRVDEYADPYNKFIFTRVGEYIDMRHALGGAGGYRQVSSSVLSWARPMPAIPGFHVQLEQVAAHGCSFLFRLDVVPGIQEVIPSGLRCHADDFYHLPLLTDDWRDPTAKPSFFAVPAKRFDNVVAFDLSNSSAKITFEEVASKVRGQKAELKIAGKVIEPQWHMTHQQFASVVGHAMLAANVDRADVGRMMSRYHDHFASARTRTNRNPFMRVPRFILDALTGKLTNIVSPTDRNAWDRFLDRYCSRGLNTNQVFDPYQSVSMFRTVNDITASDQLVVASFADVLRDGRIAAGFAAAQARNVGELAIRAAGAIQQDINERNANIQAARAVYNQNAADRANAHREQRLREAAERAIEQENVRLAAEAERLRLLRAEEARQRILAAQRRLALLARPVVPPPRVAPVHAVAAPVVDPEHDPLIAPDALPLPNAEPLPIIEEVEVVVVEPEAVVEEDEPAQDVVPEEAVVVDQVAPEQDELPVEPERIPTPIPSPAASIHSRDMPAVPIQPLRIVRNSISATIIVNGEAEDVLLPIESVLFPPRVEAFIPARVDFMAPLADIHNIPAAERTNDTQRFIDQCVADGNLITHPALIPGRITPIPQLGACELLARAVGRIPAPFHNASTVDTLAYCDRALQQEDTPLHLHNHLRRFVANIRARLTPNSIINARVDCVIDGVASSGKSSLVRRYVNSLPINVNLLVMVPSNRLVRDWRTSWLAVDPLSARTAVISTWHNLPRSAVLRDRCVVVIDEVFLWSRAHLAGVVHYIRSRAENHVDIILLGDSQQLEANDAADRLDLLSFPRLPILQSDTALSMPQDVLAYCLDHHLVRPTTQTISPRARSIVAVERDLPMGSFGEDLAIFPFITAQPGHPIANARCKIGSVAQLQGVRAGTASMSVGFNRAAQWGDGARNGRLKYVAITRHTRVLVLYSEAYGICARLLDAEHGPNVVVNGFSRKVDRFRPRMRLDKLFSRPAVSEAVLRASLTASVQSSLDPEIVVYRGDGYVDAPVQDSPALLTCSKVEVAEVVAERVNRPSVTESAEYLPRAFGSTGTTTSLASDISYTVEFAPLCDLPDAARLADIQQSSQSYSDARNVVERQFSTVKPPVSESLATRDAAILFQRFVACLFSSTAIETLGSTVDFVTEWLVTRENAYLRQLADPLGESARSLLATGFLKTQNKVKPKEGFAADLNYGQTVISNDSAFGAVIAPSAREFNARLRDYFRDDFVLDIGLSDAELQKELVTKGMLSQFAESNMQADIVKQDSNHTSAHVIMLTMLMQYCGMPVELCDLYYAQRSHQRVKSMAPNRYSGSIKFALGSGDPLTLTANCIQALSTLCIKFRVMSFAVGVQKGDDIILHPRCLDVAPEHRLAERLGVQVKVDEHLDYSQSVELPPYHAGRFFLPDAIVADPVRIFLKTLSRVRVESVSLEEYHVALVDRAFHPTHAQFDYLLQAIPMFYPDVSPAQADVMMRAVARCGIDKDFFFTLLANRSKPGKTVQFIDTPVDCAVSVAKHVLPGRSRLFYQNFRHRSQHSLAALFVANGVPCTILDPYRTLPPRSSGVFISVDHCFWLA